MKIRKGFVSNSSSTSFIVYASKDLMGFSDEEIVKSFNGSLSEENEEDFKKYEPEIIKEVRNLLDSLCSGEDIYRDMLEVGISEWCGFGPELFYYSLCELLENNNLVIKEIEGTGDSDDAIISVTKELISEAGKN